MGNKCLFVIFVSGNKRLPVPPARTTPFINGNDIKPGPAPQECAGPQIYTGKDMPSDLEKRIVAIVQQVSKQPVELAWTSRSSIRGGWIPSPSRKW